MLPAHQMLSSRLSGALQITQKIKCNCVYISHDDSEDEKELTNDRFEASVGNCPIGSLSLHHRSLFLAKALFLTSPFLPSLLQHCWWMRPRLAWPPSLHVTSAPFVFCNKFISITVSLSVTSTSYVSYGIHPRRTWSISWSTAKN